MATYTKTLVKSVYDESSASTGLNITRRPQAVELKGVRTGEINPRYKDQIGKLLNATTPLTAYEQSVKIVSRGQVDVVFTKSQGGGSFSSTEFGVGNVAKVWAVPNGAYPIDNSYRNVAVAEARSRVASKINKLQSPFNTQVFAAELGETIGLLRGPYVKTGKRVIELLTSFNAARKKGQKLKADDISSAWLEMRFGLLPLLSDIKDISNLINEKADDRKITQLRSYGEATKVLYYGNSVSNGSTPGLLFKITDDYVQKYQTFITCGLALEYQDRANGLSALTDQLLDVTQLPVTAWELIPFSFLVDYFVNVGDIIQSSCTARNAVSYVSESTAITTQRSYHSTFWKNDRPDLIASANPVSPTRHVISTLRNVARQGGSLGIPPMTFTLPGSGIRYANIAALIHQFSK